MKPVTLADFRRSTQFALKIRERTAHYASRDTAYYAVRAMLLFALGALLWLDSPALATALAVTGTLYTVWWSASLALRASVFAQDFVRELSDDERAKAAGAWAWLSYLRSVMTVRFVGLSAGMTALPALKLLWTGHSSPTQGLHWVVLDSCVLNIILFSVARSFTLVSPLLKKLMTAPQ